MATARFDDLRPGRRRSFALSNPLQTVTAETVDDVKPVLATVERAVRAGRWVAGWVSYEAAPAFDSSLVVRSTAGTAFDTLPLAWFAVFAGRAAAGHDAGGYYTLGEWTTTTTADAHAREVTAIREHIRQGRTYQVNHTFRMYAPFAGDTATFYRDLSHSQNSSYAALIDSGRWVVASASPELFFEWRNGRIVSTPMKGTTDRGLDVVGDEERREWLEHSEKNRAENLMIVDMIRNDLGRIARIGSVEVPVLFATEKYDTLWQMTSTVVAVPRQNVDLAGVFSALFPCASITGAPKVSTMSIIADLETEPRGVYCGAIGFGGPDASGRPQWVFNVGIRTVLIDREHEVAIYGTGGGITYDSTPEDEYREALLKAAVLGRRSADFELLETMRFDEGFRHLDRHLDRLSASANYFDIPLDRHDLVAALDAAVEGETGPLRVRLLLSRPGEVRVEIAPAPSPRVSPVRLAVDSVPVDLGDPFLYHKTTNRRIYDEARARHPEADDVVLVNERREATETTIANLAVFRNGEWRTPPTASGCLPGVERAHLIEQGHLVESRVTVADLLAASDVARFNSLRGWEECRLVEA